MTITMRPFVSKTDFIALAELVKTMPNNTPHIVDLPWRMSSPVTISGRDAYVWQDEDGLFLGFAAWQNAWATLDYYVRPGSHKQDIEQQLYGVMEQRFRELDQERGEPLPYWIEFRDDDIERKAIAEQYSYTHETDYHYVQMLHSLNGGQLLEELPYLPTGFTLRPLAGVQEVEAYVALHRAAFESTSMTSEWRQRTLLTPTYRSELDIVVVAPDNTLAGFCVGWLDLYRSIGQIEPIGVHPNFQGMGLGRVLLYEILRRFQAYGAKEVRVEPNNGRTPAQQAYESVGFQIAHKIVRQGKYV